MACWEKRLLHHCAFKGCMGRNDCIYIYRGERGREGWKICKKNGNLIVRNAVDENGRAEKACSM